MSVGLCGLSDLLHWVVSHPLVANASSDGLSPMVVLRHCPWWESCAVLRLRREQALLNGRTGEVGLSEGLSLNLQLQIPSLSCLAEVVAMS